MAITAFKIISRSFVPGTMGYDTSGNPKQAKIRVIGEFNNSTSYTSGGESLPRNRFGVSTIDMINFWVKGSLPTSTKVWVAQYDDTNQKVLVQEVDAAPNEAPAAVGVIKFEVFGDPALPTENTISDSINTGLPV